MRIAIATWNLRQIAGIESYLATIIPELVRARSSVSLLGEVDVPASRAPIADFEVPTWCIAAIGRQRAIDAVRQWNPDIIFMNGAPALTTQRDALEIAPVIFYAHGYHGTCISGAKAYKFPQVRPCHRRFGAGCLLHYWPHRCGGLNPITMLRKYQEAREQGNLLRSYQTILTDSSYLAAEYLEHRFIDPSRVVALHYPIRPSRLDRTQCVPRSSSGTEPLRLMFAGRMTILKGGQLMIRSLAEVVRALKRPVRLTVAGDGPERQRWEQLALRIMAKNPALLIDFVGWLDERALGSQLDRADLMIVPSLWPEPFGLVGPEAGLHGLPQVAFAVGGISEWLIDGINGYLAPGEPPTSSGLANAIVKCVQDPTDHARLRRGAIEVASRFTVNRHLESLLHVFEEVSRRPALGRMRISAEKRN
jgi:glycosyltransferase involved in cell wall biosynthesis